MWTFYLVTLFASSVVAQGDFSASCDWYNLGSDQDGWRLWAGCHTFDGEVRCNGLNLNNCVGNYNGVFGGSPHGNAEGSCWSPSVAPEKYPDGHYEAILWAWCRNDAGVESQTPISLDSIIVNDDGWLECYGIRGDECA